VNKVTTVVSLTVCALVSVAGCSGESSDFGGGVDGTGAGAFEIFTPKPDSNPFTVDNPGVGGPDLGCLGNVYNSSTLDLFTTDLAPPIWLQGNWIGQRDDGQVVVIVTTDKNVAFGGASQQTHLVDGLDIRVVTELTSTNQMYSYEASDMADGKIVSYIHEYAFIDADHIQYTISSDDYRDETIVMTTQDGSELIRPPSWLLGEWLNEQCETRLFDSGNISIEFANGAPTISIAELLSGSDATFQTLYKDDEIYKIAATYRSMDGSQILRFQDTYILQEDGTVKHYAANRVQSLSRR